MAADSPVLAIVDGARWVKVTTPPPRMFVWKGGLSVQVYSTVTWENVDDWPCEEPTVESAEQAVAERTNSGY